MNHLQNQAMSSEPFDDGDDEEEEDEEQFKMQLSLCFNLNEYVLCD